MALKYLLKRYKELEAEVESQDKTIDKLVEEQEEREKYTHSLEEENKRLIIEKAEALQEMRKYKAKAKDLKEQNKGLIESNKEWLKHYSILETESKILKAENEQYKKQFEDIKNNILVPSITEKNFIPISVIQNKIDELKHRESKNGFEFACKLKGILYLQELLEERR